MGACRWPEDAERLVRGRPPRLANLNRPVALETTPLCRCSRFPPRQTRRGTCLGCAFCWTPERHGVPRVRRRTARQPLPAAGQRRTAGLNHHRPRPGRAGCPRLPARLRGHAHYDGVRGPSRARNRVFHGAMDWTFTWLNRRGGKPRSDTWEPCPHSHDRVKIARPRLTEVKRRRRVCLQARLCPAEASTTAEPEAGPLHVRDCTGGAGEPAFLP